MASIIIPAYNERDHIGLLLSLIPKNHDIIVVDDGSADDTSEIVKKFGLMPVILEKNSGKGSAVLEGLKHSKSELCVFLDGDAQLNPKDINKIIEGLKKYDLVIGKRNEKKIPFMRRISNRYAKKMVNFITKEKFNDVLCGFRGIRKSKFEKLHLEKKGYYFESETIIQAAKNNFSIIEVPVDVTYKIGSRMPFTKSMSVGLWLLKEAIKKIFRIK